MIIVWILLASAAFVVIGVTMETHGVKQPVAYAMMGAAYGILIATLFVIGFRGIVCF